MTRIKVFSETETRFLVCIAGYLLTGLTLFGGQTADSSTSAATTRSIIEQLCDFQRLGESYTIITKFEEQVMKDSILHYENELGGVDIITICYFDNQVNEFYPNIFREIAKGGQINTSTLYIHLAYVPQNSKYKIIPKVTGNEAFDTEFLENLLRSNLTGEQTLESKEVTSDVFLSLREYKEGKNQDILCSISPVREPLRTIMEALVSEKQNEIDSLSIVLGIENSDTTDPTDESGTVEEEIDGFLVDGVSEEYDINKKREVENAPEDFRFLMEEYLLNRSNYEKLGSDRQFVEYYSGSDKLCIVITELESKKETDARELYSLVDEGNEEEIVSWIRSFLKTRDITNQETAEE